MAMDFAKFDLTKYVLRPALKKAGFTLVDYNGPEALGEGEAMVYESFVIDESSIQHTNEDGWASGSVMVHKAIGIAVKRDGLVLQKRVPFGVFADAVYAVAVDGLDTFAKGRKMTALAAGAVAAGFRLVDRPGKDLEDGEATVEGDLLVMKRDGLFTKVTSPTDDPGFIRDVIAMSLRELELTRRRQAEEQK